MLITYRSNRPVLRYNRANKRRGESYPGNTVDKALVYGRREGAREREKTASGWGRSKQKKKREGDREVVTVSFDANSARSALENQFPGSRWIFGRSQRLINVAVAVVICRNDVCELSRYTTEDVGGGGGRLRDNSGALDVASRHAQKWWDSSFILFFPLFLSSRIKERPVFRYGRFFPGLPGARFSVRAANVYSSRINRARPRAFSRPARAHPPLHSPLHSSLHSGRVLPRRSPPPCPIVRARGAFSRARKNGEGNGFAARMQQRASAFCESREFRPRQIAPLNYISRFTRRRYRLSVRRNMRNFK